MVIKLGKYSGPEKTVTRGNLRTEDAQVAKTRKGINPADTASRRQKSAKKYDNKVKPILVKVRINKKKLEVDVDSRAAISVIPRAVFDKNFSGVVLRPSNIILKEFTGTRSEPLGYFVGDVEYNGKCRNLEIYIVSSSSTALLDRAGLTAFGLGFVNLVDNKEVENIMQVRTEYLDKFVEEHAEVFKDELRTYKHAIVKLNLNYPKQQ
ncbi:hypothetical protein ILUMI_04669 [Ignelater luminosus]|uniref:Uncharacterized protein n=1 Tax=Ignelater luminosus TaxID=2038154 RepID=A0A8K0DDF1_IGNLU|nr:hypothetical protein ILUMI_04669 [Ignelater luminosus]